MAHATRPERATLIPPMLHQPALSIRQAWRVQPFVPPTLLALLTLVLLTLAYSVRPTVWLDLGNYYDSIFVQNFHARELDAAAPEHVFAWDAATAELVLPGGYHSHILIEVQADPNLPDRPLGLVALSVNDIPVSMPRSSSHRFTAFVPAEQAAAPELHLRLRPALTGGPEPDPAVVQQVAVAPARTYRWSRAESRLVFPGLGRGAWQVNLDLVTAHPNGEPVNAQLAANGVHLVSLPDSNQLRRVSLLVPAALMDSGNLELTVQANTYPDPRPLGVFLADVQLAPISPPRALFPPPLILLSGMGMALGLYAVLAILLVGILPRQAAPMRWLASSIALAGLAVLAVALTYARFPISFMPPSLAVLAGWSLCLLLILRPLVLRLSPSPQFGYALLLLFFGSYWLKAVGMLYPYFVAIDVHWHMERVRWILQGQLPLLYGTDSPLNESTMPVAEWGSERPVIPYSPWFHMIATSYSLLPFRLEFTNNMVSALVDTSRILMIGLVAVRAGIGQRGGLLAAGLLAVLPVNFLLHSWGNAPTTMGLWWSLAATLWAIALWPRLHERLPFIVLTVLLLGTFLIYTVAGVFMGAFLVLFSGFVWLAAGHSRQTALRASLRPLWYATALAVALSMLIYYVQYVPLMIERTVPYFVGAFSGTTSLEESGKATDTLSDYITRHTRLTTYGLVIPILLGLLYLAWGWLQRFQFNLRPELALQPPAPAAAVILWAAVGGWVTTMLIFLPLAYVVSMVDKHFFVAIPMLMLASGALLERFWQRGWWARGLILLYYAYLLVAAVNLWLTRIVTVKQG